MKYKLVYANILVIAFIIAEAIIGDDIFTKSISVSKYL
jgi:hypothetical protein